MANLIPAALRLAVALILLLSTPAIAASDTPFLVAHKKVGLTRLKSGAERISVSIDIYNQGSATAYDVTLNDDNWTEDSFEVVSGNKTRTWERLDVGGMLAHSFILESKVKGLFQTYPALIKFRVPTKAALQEAYSTPVLPLDILAERLPQKKFELVKRILAQYGSLVLVISFVSLFIYVVATPSKSSAAKGSKKRR